MEKAPSMPIQNIDRIQFLGVVGLSSPVLAAVLSF